MARNVYKGLAKNTEERSPKERTYWWNETVSFAPWPQENTSGGEEKKRGLQ